MDLLLWEGQQLFGSLKGVRGKRYYRTVWVDSKNDTVFIRQVYSDVPANSSLAKKYSIKEVEARLRSGKLIEQEESIRPAVMSQLRDDPEDEFKARATQAYRQRLLGNLITAEGRSRFYSDIHERSRLLREQAKRAGVSVQRLLMLLTFYENFGCDVVALRPYPSAETRKRGAVLKKRGAKNVYEKGNSRSPLKNYPVTRWALRHIQWAVWHLVILLGFTYEDARVIMHRRFWHQDNGAKSEGTRTRYPVKMSKMVTAAQFAAYARRYKKNPEKLRHLVGAREWRDRYAAGRGTAADLALGPGDILVIDGTIAKFEIVSSISRRPIGRPTLMVVADLWTGTILSIHITTNPESANTYRSVLFRACTSQGRLMKQLGLPENLFDFKVRPNDILVDRGSANSKRFRQPLTSPDGADIGLMIAPIACGRAKGTIESLINVLTRRLRNLPGAFTRERTELAKDGRRRSKLVAKVTRKELLRYAYEAAKEYNEQLLLKRHFPETRRASEPKANPSREELFRHAVSGRRGGENRQFAETDVYTALLPRLRPRRMSKEGVSHQDADFTSEQYRLAYEIEISKCLGDPKKLPMITPLQDPDDPTVLYWKRSPGDIVLLECSPTDAQRWRGLVVEDVELDLGVQDSKTKIRHERKKTFSTPLPGHVVDSFINSRHTVRNRLSSGEQATARAAEGKLEKYEAAERARLHAGKVAARSVSGHEGADRQPVQTASRDTQTSAEDREVEQQVRAARDQAKRDLREGMAKIISGRGS
ncbi:hypothetical protein AYM40_29120 [Paraburkholderia phytofirmans OLGA172]|uniref:Integrase catalytic domain-containing protein n=1 Tax=Paraburkholderia phytofirmans OLGA172 TaxID=1417228 RepID=A0A160FT41_9BURK|nr:hypothetical protein [Paraburkholderia phytofirmans]ANB76310.1 hypothetical protein AYM40_29120 [Paraburkholderia phytofirmans OLGA172]